MEQTVAEAQWNPSLDMLILQGWGGGGVGAYSSAD